MRTIYNTQNLNNNWSTTEYKGEIQLIIPTPRQSAIRFSLQIIERNQRKAVSLDAVMKAKITTF